MTFIRFKSPRFKMAAAGTAAVVLLAMLGGCGSVPATSKGMLVQDVVVQKTHPYSVIVRVSGGSQSDETHPAQVTNDVLMKAIVDSIKNSKLFASVNEQSVADYELNVMIFQLSQPVFGFAMTVFVEMGWTLSHRPSKRVIWQKAIKTSGRGNLNTAFSALERLRLTTEIAARENVKQAIEKISRLKF